MAGSEIEIVNLAASRAEITDLLEDPGEGQTLEQLTEGLEQPLAKQARIWYPRTRDLVLRRPLTHAIDWSWPFATVRDVLALVDGEKRDSWAYVYAYPDGCLAMRFIVPAGLRNPRADQKVPYRLEARRAAAAEDPERGVVGQLVLTDQRNAEACYIARIDNPAVFPPDFEDALTWKLAAEFARAIVKGDLGRKLAVDAMTHYEREVRVAIAAAVNEEKRDPEPEGEILASRKGR